jgi:opacity protein-like surface antigen
MKKLVTILLLGGVTGIGAFAADVPKADLFLGYSFLRYNSAQNVQAFTANGGVGTIAWNFTSHIAAEFEFGGYHNGNINNNEFDTTSFSYLFGPRISMSRSRTIVPYMHALFGGQNAHTSIEASALPPAAVPASTTGRVSRDQNGFAMAIGGGLDIRLSHGLSLRPIQLDYYLTRFQAVDFNSFTGPSTNRNQNNLRYAAGILFNFGSKQ